MNRDGAPSLSRQPSPRRQQALEQARSHRQRVPPSGRPPHRRRSLRPDPHARTSRISRATVYRTLQWMVDAGIARKVDFGEGRFRFEHSYRHPRHFHLICKSCNRSFEFLSSDIEALLEEVAAARNFTAAPERAPDPRHVRGVPHRAARRWPKSGATELLFARDALRIAIATERSGLEFYTRAPRDHPRRARPPRVREARRRGEGAPRHARGALPRAAAAGSAARVAADVPLLQGRGQRAVRGRRRAAGQRRRRSRGADDRHPLRARLAPLLQAIRREVRRLRGQADLPRVRRRGTRAPRAAHSRIPRARRAPAAKAARQAAASASRGAQSAAAS